MFRYLYVGVLVCCAAVGHLKFLSAPASAAQPCHTALGDGGRCGSGRFRGQSPNSPRLRHALRVLRSEIAI